MKSDNDKETQFIGCVHVAISGDTKERLRAAEYKIADGPRSTSYGYYESIVLDPDSNRVEITV